MCQKVKTVSAITMTLSALYLLLADSAPFSVWQHNKTCSWTTLIFLRPLFRVNYCPEIDKLDEGSTNADDQMMLVQHYSGDRVMR